MHKIKTTLLAVATALACLGSAQAAQVNLSFNNGVLHNASGLSEVTVTSPQMDGMGVTMCFAGDLGCETATWGDGAVGVESANFVQGDGWRFEASLIDTFNEPFRITVVGQGRALQSFRLNGFGALTVFDTVSELQQGQGRTSSPKSGPGQSFSVVSGHANVQAIDVNYFNKVLVAGQDYDDLYLGMTVSFAMAQGFDGVTGSFRFIADTDRVEDNGKLAVYTPPNPNPTPMPLPGTLALVGAALFGLGLARRRAA